MLTIVIISTTDYSLQNSLDVSIMKKRFFSSPLRAYFSSLAIVSVGGYATLFLVGYLTVSLAPDSLGMIARLSGNFGTVLGQVWFASLAVGCVVWIYRALTGNK